MRGRVLVLWAASNVVPSAFAHHSFAPHFDANKPVSIAGTVVEYEARNPHSYLRIAAVDENGKTREYVCESHGVTQLTRNGIAPAMLAAGAKLRVEGSQSRHNPYMCFFDSVELADGRVLSVNGPGAGRAAMTTAAQPRRDIFGKWLLVPANRPTSGPQPMMQFLTPAGERAVAAYDPFRDDPTFRCDPVAIRRVWFAPNTPLEILRGENSVILRHEWMDVERTVCLNVTEHPKDRPRTSLGHSMGRFEGDTLVIETANYSEGVLNQYVEQPGQPTKGLLHSAALTSTERVSFDAATQRLTVTIDLTDPEFFTRPFEPATAQYAATDLALEPFNCSPENVLGTVRE